MVRATGAGAPGTARDAAGHAVVIAWLAAAVFFFYQYALRSAPAVMLPQLSGGFGMGSAAVASLVGLFYAGYAPFSLVAGVATDRLGPRRVVPAAALAVGAGALLFATGNAALGGLGRALQGAGGAFALVGAVSIAVAHLPASRAATIIGATQMFGMAGGAVGQFAVGPLLAAGVAWSALWAGMGGMGLVLCGVLLLLLPRDPVASPRSGWFRDALSDLARVLRNPQSLLCGAIAGLLFVPTTIFDMTWGVRYLQEGRGFDYTEAVLRSAMVPAGWIIGSPLLGHLSDRIGRRKPVMIAAAMGLMASMAWALHGSSTALPPYVVGLFMGIASGAAMLTYTVSKESNPARLNGTSTGVINFLNFSVSAMLGPLFARRLARSAPAGTLDLGAWQATFAPLLWGVGIAIILTFLLRETGPAVSPPVAAPAETPT